jgi:hypothetical protein
MTHFTHRPALTYIDKGIWERSTALKVEKNHPALVTRDCDDDVRILHPVLSSPCSTPTCPLWLWPMPLGYDSNNL